MAEIDRSKLQIPRVEPMDLSTLPRKMPKIEIDYSKCRVPMWCKQCLANCPQLVYKVYCVEMKRGVESDPREPGIYEALPVRRDKCTMCGKCVELCPEGAITISYDDTVLKGNWQYDTVEAARNSDYDLWLPPQPYSWELNQNMLDILEDEFDPVKTAGKFKSAVEEKQKDELKNIMKDFWPDELRNLAKDFFSSYGRSWMLRVKELGEQYSDRTYDMMLSLVDQTGELYFPLIPQRLIEIAYLSTQEFSKLTVLENWIKRIVYQVPNCYLYRQIVEQCGTNVASMMPCKDACLAGLDTLFKQLDLDASIVVEAETAKDGYCQFAINKV